MKTISFLLVGSVILAASAAGLRAGERIAVDALPESVRAAVEAGFPGAKLLSAERDAGQVYEVTVRHEGNRIEVELGEDGVITDLSGRVPVGSLPGAVTAALGERFPGAKLGRAELDVEAGVKTFEVKITHQKQRYEVEVTVDGRILDVDRE